ncbi:hypothetical protein GJ744_008158 [Endocarpon pusillum]|uniref:Uncharacterized protein n=1 Tax=Endocarpon pusillum TaxID=364733 RepID=A0A8H7AJF9_9EURO|nr:hypothetical protein GJ744_008158 [Endocarpon pusillum]
MTSDPSQVYRNIKALVTIFGELDNLVIEASREARHPSTLPVPITEGELCTLEASRHDCYNSNYGMVNMLRLLEEMPNLKPIWQSAMLSIIKLASWTIGTRDESSWKFRLTQISNVGDRAWRLVVPCTNTMTGGADTINGIIEKFALLDDTLDQLLPAFGISSQRQRFSDELRDTLYALIAISKPLGTQPTYPLQQCNKSILLNRKYDSGGKDKLQMHLQVHSLLLIRRPLLFYQDLRRTTGTLPSPPLLPSLQC